MLNTLIVILGATSSACAVPSQVDAPLATRVVRESVRVDAFFDHWLCLGSRSLEAETFGEYRQHSRAASLDAFGDFLLLAEGATDDDLRKCVETLSDAPPRAAALLLAILFRQGDPQYLPAIAAYLDDRRVAFEYPFGSPGSWQYWRHSGLPPRGTPDENLNESQTVGDVARILLEPWGFTGTRQEFPAFWRNWQTRLYSLREFHLKALAARNLVTGEVDKERIAALRRRIEQIPYPAAVLAEIYVGFPDLPAAERRSAIRVSVARLDKGTAIRFLQSRESIVPEEPDLSPDAPGDAYWNIASSICRQWDVLFERSEFERVAERGNRVTQQLLERLKAAP